MVKALETAKKVEEYEYLEKGGYNELEGQQFDYGVLLTASSYGWEQDDRVYLKLDKEEAERLCRWLLKACGK